MCVCRTALIPTMSSCTRPAMGRCALFACPIPAADERIRRREGRQDVRRNARGCNPAAIGNSIHSRTLPCPSAAATVFVVNNSRSFCFWWRACGRRRLGSGNLGHPLRAERQCVSYCASLSLSLYVCVFVCLFVCLCRRG